MCQTHAPTQMPLNTAGSQDSAGGDPLSMAIQAEQRANPTTVSVNAPTKFGKLLNLVQPMLEGAAVGGFEGKGHPGGGFGAAQEFYDKQREHKLRDAMLQHTLTSDTFRNALEAAKTQHELGRPNFPNGRVTTARNAAGVPVLLRPNPETGVDEEIPGYSPLDKNEDNVTPHMTDQGLMGISKTGEAAPITVPGAQQTLETPLGPNNPVPGNKFSGATASPRAISQVAGPAVPLHAPGFGKPKPAKVSNRNSAGAETDNLIDENPDSPTFGKPLKTGVANRAPLPDRSHNKEDEKASTQARVESYAQAALDAAGGDPDKAIQNLNGLKVKDPAAQKDLNSLLPAIRKSIGDRVKSRKPKTRNRLSAQDQAELQKSVQGDVLGEDDNEDQ